MTLKFFISYNTHCGRVNVTIMRMEERERKTQQNLFFFIMLECFLYYRFGPTRKNKCGKMNGNHIRYVRHACIHIHKQKLTEYDRIRSMRLNKRILCWIYTSDTNDFWHYTGQLDQFKWKIYFFDLFRPLSQKKTSNRHRLQKKWKCPHGKKWVLFSNDFIWNVFITHSLCQCIDRKLSTDYSTNSKLLW